MIGATGFEPAALRLKVALWHAHTARRPQLRGLQKMGGRLGTEPGSRAEGRRLARGEAAATLLVSPAVAFSQRLERADGTAEAFNLRCAVAVSVTAQSCYCLRCVAGVIWETPV